MDLRNTSIDTAWQVHLKLAIWGYTHGESEAHVGDTPDRVLRLFEDRIRGRKQDPELHLRKKFHTDSDVMVHVEKIQINTTCAHHLMPIIGVAHFAYIPKGYLVGLSKIPRFIGVLANRLQIQEDLCQQIVDVFQEALEPQGVAVWMKAFHCCMSSRGVYEHRAATKVLACRGAFREDPKARMELMANIDQNVPIIG